jgi:hypothetical protein
MILLLFSIVQRDVFEFDLPVQWCGLAKQVRHTMVEILNPSPIGFWDGRIGRFMVRHWPLSCWWIPKS